MYQALYRKWRPRTFADVCGQETVTTALRNELKSGRLSHAYLFTGCRGTGKTTCAKILAKAVNCLHPHDGDPCGECELCRGIDDGSVLDVTEIDAASNNGVDSIRDLRDEVAFTPVSGKYRVYIIDEVHMLSPGAFNALLKTLEEPPAHVIFILATTEVHKLPATILSRCQRFDFGRIRPETIAERVTYVAQQEGLEITPEAALLLARLADGAMRDALSLLDQCASGRTKIDIDAVTAGTGMTGRARLAALTARVAARDGAGALEEIDRLYQSSKDMERLCTEWIGYLRDVMVLQQVRQPADLVIASPEELAEMQRLGDCLGLAGVLRALSVLQTTLEQLHGGAARRVAMEMAVLRLCDPRLEDSPAALLARIEALEGALRAGAVAPAVSPAPVAAAPAASAAPAVSPPPAAEPIPPAAPETEPAESVPPPPAPDAPPAEEGEERPFTQWGDVLARLQQTCIPLYAVLAQSQAVLKGNLLLICTDNALFKELFRQDNNKQLLLEAIQQTAGSGYRIGLRRTVTVPKAEAEDPLTRLMQAGRSAGIPIDEK